MDVRNLVPRVGQGWKMLSAYIPVHDQTGAGATMGRTLTAISAVEAATVQPGEPNDDQDIGIVGSGK